MPEAAKSKAKANAKDKPKARASVKEAAAKPARAIDPFKTKRTKETAARTNDTVTPPAVVAEAIDRFRECQEQAKHFEGEATVHKDMVMDFALSEFVRRLALGHASSFKLLGDETTVTYVVTEASAGLTEEDVEAFAARWSDAAAQELITRDLRSIRFDPDVLAANYEQVVKALQVLPPEVLDHLFKPMLMMARPGAIELGKRHAKSPDDLRELIRMLKIKNYVR